MKRSLKQTVLMLLVVGIAISACFGIVSCGRTSSRGTLDGTIPGLNGSGSHGGTTGNGTLPGGSDVTTNGTQGTTQTPVTPPEGNGDYINPLTGLKTTYNMGDSLKPLAVVVDNVSAAYAHQSGLTQSDLLYETLVSPGITRFVMLVSDYTALDPICNIRSGRLEHLDIVGSHNAILVAHNGSTYNDFVSVAASRLGGGWNETLGKSTFGYINTMNDIAFTAEGGKKYGTIKYYDADPDYRKDIAYDTLLTTSAVMAIFQSRYSLFNQSGATSLGSAPSFDFVDLGTFKKMDGSAATNIAISFTADNAGGKKSVAYVYDVNTGKYLRSQDGKAHVDSVTGEQLAFTNVITLFTDVTSEKTGLSSDPTAVKSQIVGSGSGYYFYGGKAVEINWSKTAWDAPLVFTDKSGNPFELARGTTYIGYLDNTDVTKSVSFN
jgi:hypothetical protein